MCKVLLLFSLHLFSEIVGLSFLHSTCQLHLVWKCMSYHKLPETAWMLCTNWGAWNSWSSRDDHVSILKPNLRIFRDFGCVGSIQMEHSEEMSKLASLPCDILCRYSLGSRRSRVELAWHFVQAKYTKLIIVAFFLWHGVSLMWQYHFASKEGLVHSHSAFSVTQQIQLLIWVARDLREHGPLRN